MPQRRILLTTFGSLGDLHPSLALACELRRRGHFAAVGSVEDHRPAIEDAGIEFRLVRSAVIEHVDRALMRKVLAPRGAEYIVRKLLMPSLRLAYADTLAAAEGMDLLITHPLTLATPLVAEMRGLPWASTQLAPLGFLSAYDPPILQVTPFAHLLRPLGRRFFTALFWLAARSVEPWTRPYQRLRAELGLARAPGPLLAGGHSPQLVLALFSALLGDKQPDWPAQTVVTGFTFYDGAGHTPLAPELERFLDAGEPPLVFTLGSSAVIDAGRFFQTSAEAAQMLGRRAVLLTGSDPANQPASLPSSILAIPYAPHSLMFSRAAATVHQGGSGTTGQAMRAGRPMLVMPYAIDQPDNAARVERLGIARVIGRRSYTATRAARLLDELLTSPEVEGASRRVGAQLQTEDGAAAACDALEARFGL